MKIFDISLPAYDLKENVDFQAIGVQIKSIDKHVFFDSQEACDIHHNGQWAARFQRVIH